MKHLMFSKIAGGGSRIEGASQKEPPQREKQIKARNDDKYELQYYSCS